MLSECPSCFTTVVPKDDGSCPACQQNMRGIPVDSSRCSLRVSQGEQLPPICCRCGGATVDKVAIVRSSAEGRDEFSTTMKSLIASLFSLPMAVFAILKGIHETSVVEVRVPLCKQCVLDGPIEPRYVDFRNASMTLIVHKNLKNAIEREFGDTATNAQDRPSLNPPTTGKQSNNSSNDTFKIEPRISIITLGVANMARAIRFYRDGLGFPTSAQDDADWAIFATAGTRFAIFPRDRLAADIGPEVLVPAPGFGGITLAHNVRSKAEVDTALQIAAAAGGRILKPAQTAEWGGYSGYFADPDGHPWEVAWGESWSFAADGTLYGGPLGEAPNRDRK